MASTVDDPVKRAGMVAIFASWQRAAFELAYQTNIRDAAAKKVDDETATISACREACKAFGVDPNNADQMGPAVEAYIDEAIKIYNETKPNHLPHWYAPAPPPPPQEPANYEIAPPTLETPPPPPMPRIRDVVMAYLETMHDLELGGTKAAAIRIHIEQKYMKTIHEKTVGMTLYRLLKEGKVRRRGHEWFFVPQTTAETKNPGVSAPGPSE